ncbi:Transcription initiation factor TFIID subunit 5 [Porphyridium purpureum]|uniref:Transcription initiation factor TFIID subunit 5 n=1 Tax=Porphyridium purpureum TaxID=35688 RepID=A0A5J4YTZ7_PORPP|nr:Transcription initiation factor TFIID subunit 5 [Porphyridium purpureum]|eukprot:POR4129..scf227_4
MSTVHGECTGRTHALRQPLKRPLYGCIDASKRWYDHLCEMLSELGFEQNAYDACVLRKVSRTGEPSVTALVHVDDVELIAESEQAIDEVVARVRERFPSLQEHRGRTHSYLGMEFDYTSPGVVRIGMGGFVDSLLRENDVRGTADTPAQAGLFVDDESQLLTSHDKEAFHSATAKVLYLAKRIRPDLLTAVAFLATRVQAPGENDRAKLTRLLRYLNKTRDMRLELGTGWVADEREPDCASHAEPHVECYVDASFATHANMRSHTGGVVSLGRGAAYATSVKQKLNTKSSTEAELVGVSDVIGQAIWTRNFLEAQGIRTAGVRLHQDNEATMSLLAHGRATSRRSRHIAIKHFFTHDLLKRRVATMVHCSTEVMIADLLTKPLQGKRFAHLRDMILGRAPTAQEPAATKVREASVPSKVWMAGSYDGTGGDAMGPGLGSGLDGSSALIAYLRARNYKKAEYALLQETLASRLPAASGSDGDGAGAQEIVLAAAAAGDAAHRAPAPVKWTAEPQGTDEELRNVILLMTQRSANAAAELDPQVIEHAYFVLQKWVDSSLELYKGELHSVLYPMLVHCFLELVRRGYVTEGKTFLERAGAELKMSGTLNASNLDELLHLAGVASIQHMEENEVSSRFLKERYEIYLTPFAFELLIGFLTDDPSRTILLRILNQRCRVKFEVPRAPGAVIASAIANKGAARTAAASGRPSGFVRGSEQEDLIASKTVLWGRLKPTQYIVPDDPAATTEAAAAAAAPDGDQGEEEKPAVTEADGTISSSPVPLPKFRLGAQGLETPDDIKNRHALSRTCLPSALFYTFTNTAGCGVHCVDAAPDASMLVAGFEDSTVRMWDVKAGTCSTCIGHQGPVYDVSVSPDNRYSLSSSEDGSIRLWSNALKTDLVAYRGHNYPVWCVSFSPLGYYFVSGGHDRSARLWSTDHISPLRIFAGHLADVDCVAWHVNCNYVFSGSSDRSARMWDVRTGDAVRLFGLQDGAVGALATSPDGSKLAMAGEGQVIEEWDISSGRKIQTLKGHEDSIWSLAYSMDGSLLASGSADCTVRIWEAHTGSMVSASAAGTAASTVHATKHMKNTKTSSPLRTMRTKNTPVQFVRFTRKNLLFGAGAYAPPRD